MVSQMGKFELRKILGIFSTIPNLVVLNVGSLYLLYPISIVLAFFSFIIIIIIIIILLLLCVVFFIL